MKTNLQSKWWMDVVLFSAFLVTFFLDLTGLSLHQWIGLAGGLFALYHLIARWNWIKAVSARFMGKKSNQARLYYLIDAALLAGFFTIVSTGLVISSWLSLSLANYAAWRLVHIGASVVTLLVVMIKLGLHWRWIASTARKIFASPVPVPLQRTAIPSQGLSRREFLKVMGLVGVSSVFALGSSIRSLQDSTQTIQPDIANVNTVSSDAGTVAAVLTDASAVASATADTSTAQAAVSTTTSSAQAVSTGSTTTSACVVRCNRGCSFPGRCGRYTDSNGNNRCDLGECL